MKKSIIQSPQMDIFQPPAFRFRGPQVFRELRKALAEAFGTDQSLTRLATLTGKPRATTHHWFHVFSHPHLIFFLGLLEQLPEKKRVELVNQFCRELPLLNHPRLDHDPMAIGALENIAKKKTGFTIISGRNGTDFQRSFVLAALGNAIKRSPDPGLLVAGIDIHEPIKLVPINGLTYLRDSVAELSLQTLVKEAWVKIDFSNINILLLNCVWSRSSHLRRHIIERGQTCHVVLAEANGQEIIDSIQAAKQKATLVTVSHAKENSSWIRVQVSET